MTYRGRERRAPGCMLTVQLCALAVIADKATPTERRYPTHELRISIHFTINLERRATASLQTRVE